MSPSPETVDPSFVLNVFERPLVLVNWVEMNETFFFFFSRLDLKPGLTLSWYLMSRLDGSFP